MQESETQRADVEALRSTEAQVEEANRAGDIKALQSLIDDDFRFTSGQGGAQSKSEWLAGVESKRLSPETRNAELKTVARATEKRRGTVLLLTGLRVGEETEYDVELHGDVGITHRRYAIQNADGSERCLRYVRVYRHKDGQWRLTSHRYIHAVD